MISMTGMKICAVEVINNVVEIMMVNVGKVLSKVAAIIVT